MVFCVISGLSNYMWHCASLGGVAVYRYIIIEMFWGVFLNTYYYLFLSVCIITSRAKIKFLGIDLNLLQNPCSGKHLSSQAKKYWRAFLLFLHNLIEEKKRFALFFTPYYRKLSFWYLQKIHKINIKIWAF